MLTVGVRDLKNRLTQYLGEVKNGENIIVTDRGKPFAILHRLDKVVESASLDERLAALAAQGHLTLPRVKGPLSQFKPIKLEGGSVSESLIRDRR